VRVNPVAAARAESTVKEAEAAAGALGLQVQIFNVGTRHEINAAFEAVARERPAALFVGPDPFFTNRRVQLANLAARHASVARPSRSRCADELWDQLNRSGFAGGSNS